MLDSMFFSLSVLQQQLVVLSRDYGETCISVQSRQLFYYLKEQGLVDSDDDIHLFSLLESTNDFQRTKKVGITSG